MIAIPYPGLETGVNSIQNARAVSTDCNNQHLTFDRYRFIWHKKNEEKGQISLLGAETKRISYYGKSYTVVLLVYDRLNFESESRITRFVQK